MKTNFTKLFKNRNFLWLWFAQILSLATAYMLNFVLMDKIYRLTASTVAVGLLFGFFILPTMILGPFVGVLIDLFRKEKILFWSSFSQSIVVLFYLLVNDKIWTIYPLILLYSLCDEFFNPCVFALVPSFVKREELPLANSFFLLTTQGAYILGFGLGGVILKLFDLPWSFPLASILLLISAGLAKGLPSEEGFQKKEIKNSLGTLWHQLKEGYYFIKDEPRVFIPIIFMGGLQIILTTALVLLPSISQGIFKIAFTNSPFVLITPALLGAVIGGLVIEKQVKLQRKKNLITKGMFLLGAAVLTLALIPFLNVLNHQLFLLGPFLALILGIAFILMYVPLQTLIQEHTLFNFRGRVFATLNTVVSLAAVLPVLVTATLVDLLGIQTIVFLLGSGLIILAIYVKRKKYVPFSTNYRA